MLVPGTFRPSQRREEALLAKGRNWEAIGAIAELHTPTRKLTRFVHTSYSYASANDPRLHFGLGRAAAATVDIYWPNGLHETLARVAANQLITVREGAGVVPGKGWKKV